MLETSGSLGVANEPGDPGFAASDGLGDLGEDFSFPGLVAWAVCALGLAIAMFGLVTGQMWLAMAGLGVAVMGPSLGLAWVFHAQRGAYNVALPSRD